MANPSDLILGILFKAKPDPQFQQIVRRLSSIITEFNKGMDKATAAEKRMKKSTADLEKEAKKLGQTLDKDGKIIDSTNKQIGKITKGIDRLIAAFKVVAVYTVAGRVFQGFQAAVRSGVKEIIDFDQALANLKAITGATDQEIQGMRETLKDTAMRTKFSTTEIAEGMVLLGQAGLTGAESMQAIDAVADLAAGTLSDFRNVSDLVTTTLRAFNLEAAETRRIADVMANAVNKSKLSIDKLRTAFNYVGAGAHQAGLTLETTAASMMVLANNGLRASTIGTGLRQVLARLLAPNAKLREAMSNYGLELDKATGKSDWFETQISKLASVMYNYETKTVDMSKAYSLFGLRGAQAAAILVNAYMSLDGTWEIMNERANEVGTAAKMMQDQAEGLGFKIKNLADSFGVLSVNLGEAGLTTVMRWVIDSMRTMTKAASELATTWAGKMIATFVGVTGALYTMNLGFMALQTQLLENTARALKFRTAMIAFFWGPVGKVILVLGALAAAIALVNHLMGARRRALVKEIAEEKKAASTLESYSKKFKDVEEGSKEYLKTIERLKQALPDYADKIDDLANNYKNLTEWMEKTRKAQDDLAFQKTKELFAIDMKTLERQAREASDVFLEGFDDEVYRNLFTKNKELESRISEMAQDIYQYFVQGFAQGKGSEEIKEALTNLFVSDKVMGELRKKFPQQVDAIWGKVLKMIQNYEKRMILETMKLQSTKLREIRRLIPEFGTLMDKLFKEEKYYQLADLIKAATNALSEWIKQEKMFEGLLAGKDMSEKEREEAMHKYKIQFFKKELEEFLKKEGKKDKRSLTSYYSISRAIDKLKGKYASTYEKEYRDADNFYKSLEDRVKKNVEDQAERKEMMLAIWRAYYATLIELANKYKQFPGAMLPEIEERLKALGKLTGQKGLEGAKVPTGENVPTGQVGYPDEDKHRAELAGIDYKRQEKDWRDEESTVEEQYRRGEKSAREYFDYLDRLEREGAISRKENLKKQRTETQGLWANLKEGWRDYFGEMQTTGEFVQQFAGDLIEQLSTGFADAWGDFLSGTKDAKEAFADFARDILRWLAQMAMKRALLSIFGSAFHGGGMYGEGGPPRRIKAPVFMPKLHSGLMPDEFAAILRKDEAVFTPKQMKALGSMIKGTTEINVPVNIDGGNGDRMGRYLPGEIEQTVLKVMRKYM